MSCGKTIPVADDPIAKGLRALPGLCLLVLLSGCALSNVGSVDMRRTAAVPPPDASESRDARHLPLAYKNFSLGEDSQVQPQDSLSVTLRTAFIRDFFELGFNPLRGFQSNGEIAVVVNAFEVETGKEIDFIKMQSGRLVFFSDDVVEGQLLNLNNLPIYGPKSYNGQPFALRITIFELDGGTEQAKTLLNSIAKAGSAAYAPASPVLNLLNGIGQSLFDGAQNDTEFRYTMVFNPRPGSQFINSFVLESGNYVFVRIEDRTQKVPWERIELNENKGELFWKDRPRPDAEPKPYTDHTYLVVEINTGGSAQDIDLKQNTFDELLSALEKEDRDAAERLSSTTTAITGAVNDALLRRSRTINFNAAKQALTIIQDNKASKSSRRGAADRLLQILAGSLEPDGKLRAVDAAKPERASLSNVQVDYVVSRLRRLVEARKKTLSSEDYSTLSREKLGAAAGDKTLSEKIVDLIAPLDKP